MQTSTRIKVRFLTFQEAKQFVETLNISPYTLSGWQQYWKKNKLPKDLPAQPQDRYARQGWKGWKDFLGNGKSVYMNYDDAREFVKNLELASVQEWNDYKSGKMPNLPPIPKNIPMDPELRYRRVWRGMKYWLGLPI